MKTTMRDAVELMAVVSTQHLKPETALNLDALWTMCYPNDYGAFVYVDETFNTSHPDVDVPDDLATVLREAAKHDIVWIKFDSDGPTIDGLPVYDWE